MSSKPNNALYVTEDAQFIVRDDIRHGDMATNELLIETHYSGANPADVRHSTHLGIRSTVIGYDFAGRVLKAPSSKFRIPSNLPESDAAALTVVVMTAADVIHNLFKFPLPTSPGDFSSPILLWGASSAVGLSALQLARGSGCRNIFVTASPAHHDLLKSLGATQAFDYYSSPTVVNDIISAVEALGQGPITHALDAVGSMGSPSSSDLVSQSVGASAILSSVILRPGTTFQMPVATTKDTWCIRPPGSPGPISIPPRPADHWNAWKAFHWVINNYGTAFRLPSVDILDVTGQEALAELFRVASGTRGFGKIVYQHPFK